MFIYYPPRGRNLAQNDAKLGSKTGPNRSKIGTENGSKMDQIFDRFLGVFGAQKRVIGIRCRRQRRTPPTGLDQGLDSIIPDDNHV